MRFVQFLVVVLLFFVCQGVCAEDVITGEAVKDNVSVSILVVEFPTLEIVSPKNGTYISDEVFLNYLANNYDSIWYNIDSVVNNSISSPVMLFLDDGLHVVNLYAANTEGITHKDRWFTVNTSILDIVYGDYEGTAGGDSTDFDSFTFEELRNLSNVVLEQAAFGKIEFMSNIDVVNDSDENDGVVDLDENVKMSKGMISLNSSALLNFNVTSEIYFYLDMVNPRVLKDGEVCPNSICVNKSYSNGILSFYVDGAGGEYSVQETYVAPLVSSGGGGGGGGGSVAHEVGIREGMFGVDYDSLSISVRQGDIETREIILKNEGDTELEFEVVNLGLEDLLFLDEEYIVLGPRETRVIHINFSASEDIPIDNYLGKLVFRGDNIFKEILISVFVESKFGLFDLDVEIGEESSIVVPGEYLSADIDIVNLGEIERGNVLISYFLKSEGGEFVFLGEEIGVIDARLVLSKMFLIPEDFEDGDYVLHVRLEHMGRVSGESAWFRVRAKSFVYEAWFWIVALLGLIWVLWRKRRRRKREEESADFLE